jgi:hypothetical protein
MSTRLHWLRGGLEAVRQLRAEHQQSLTQLPAHRRDTLRQRDRQEFAEMLAELQARVDQLRPGLEREAGAAHVRAEVTADAVWLDDGGAPPHLWEAAQLDELEELEGWLREEAELGISA